MSPNGKHVGKKVKDVDFSRIFPVATKKIRKQNIWEAKKKDFHKTSDNKLTKL